MIAVCHTGGNNLNSEMVARGLAWAYREYSNDDVACEVDAKTKGVGIWPVTCRDDGVNGAGSPILRIEVFIDLTQEKSFP